MHATASLPRPALHRTASERLLLRTTTDAPRFVAARAKSQPSDPELIPRAHHREQREREPERRSRRRSLWGGRLSTLSPEDTVASCLPSLRNSRPAPHHVQTPPPDFDGLPPEPDAGLPAPPRVRINRLRGAHELDESLVQRQFAQLYTGGRNRPEHVQGDPVREQDRPTAPLRAKVTRLDSSNLPKNIQPCSPSPKAERKQTSHSNVNMFSNGMRRKRMSQIIRSALTRSSSGGVAGVPNSENVPPTQSTLSKTHVSQRSMRYSMRHRRISRKHPTIADTLDTISDQSAQNRKPLQDFNSTTLIYTEKRSTQQRTPRTVVEDSPKRTRTIASGLGAGAGAGTERPGGQRPQSQSASTLRLGMRERQDSNVPQMLAAAARPPTAPVRRQAAQRLAAERMYSAHMVPRAISDAAALPDARIMLPRTRSYAGDPTQTQRDKEGRISMREWSRPLDVEKLARLAQHDAICESPAPVVPDRNFKPVQSPESHIQQDNVRTKSLSSLARRARGRVKSALGPMPPTHTPVVKGRWAKRNASQIE